MVVICLKFRGHKKQIVGSHAGMEFEADPVPIRLNNRVLFVLFFFSLPLSKKKLNIFMYKNSLN